MFCFDYKMRFLLIKTNPLFIYRVKLKYQNIGRNGHLQIHNEDLLFPNTNCVYLNL